MEGRKSRRLENTKKVKKERKPVDKLNLISKVLGVIFTVLLVAVFAVVIYLKVLPNKYLIPLCVIVLGADAFAMYMLFRKKASNKLKFIASILSGIFIVILSFIGLKLVKTLDFLGEMTTETVNSKTYSVVVLKDSKYNKMEDLQYKLMLYYDTELNQNKQAIDKLNGVITIVTEKTDDVHELASKLIESKVDAILIEDSYYPIIEEEMADFREKTKVVYTFALEDIIQTIAKEVSVTKEPFNIYISGIDAYGKISSVARSDVNMVVSVNPQTKQVLLVNIPRDYYVKLHGTSGYRDKLTHAGIYGIDMSVKTIEDLFDIDINYYVRVNFTSLIDIIDALGGVEVYSEYDFTSRIGKYHFKKGYNKINGKQALGFARERYSFSEGDRMRGKNQQAVIDAMIKKVCSSTTILTKFDSLLDSLKGSFQTNMDYTKMVELVRMQISDNAAWKVSSISVDGLGSKERTYSMGKTLLYVMIPYSGSVNQAEVLINKVLDGELLKEGSIDLTQYNDYPVVSRGTYPTEEKKEEPKTEVEVPKVEEETPNEGTENETTPGTGEGTTTPPSSGDTPSGDSGTTTPPSSEDKPSGDSGTTPPPSSEDKPSGDSGTTTPPSSEDKPSGDSGTTPPPSSGDTPSGDSETTTEN